MLLSQIAVAAQSNSTSLTLTEAQNRGTKAYRMDRDGKQIQSLSGAGDESSPGHQPFSKGPSTL
jgi:hypothetical protein